MRRALTVLALALTVLAGPARAADVPPTYGYPADPMGRPAYTEQPLQNPDDVPGATPECTKWVGGPYEFDCVEECHPILTRTLSAADHCNAAETEVARLAGVVICARVGE